MLGGTLTPDYIKILYMHNNSLIFIRAASSYGFGPLSSLIHSLPPQKMSTLSTH